MKKKYSLVAKRKNEKVQALANYYQESIDLPPGKP